MNMYLIVLKSMMQYYREKIFCWVSRRKRNKKDLMTLEDLKTIKNIEKTIYPESLQHYQDCESLEDFMAVCDCMGIEQIYLFCKDNWYIVVVRHYNYTEIVDFASSDGKCRELYKVIGFLFENFKKDKVKISCRATTSYPLLLAFERRKKIRILSDKCIVKAEEFFHEVVVIAEKQ